MLGAFGGSSYEPLAYYVSDPEPPRTRRTSSMSKTATSTSPTRRSPRPRSGRPFSHLGWGIDKFPACFLPNDILGGSEPAGNCNPTEVTIRQGFRRVEDSDYEPVDWDGYRFQAYGGFYKDRFGFERNYGMTDDKWRRFLNRYQIWERSHYYDDPARTWTGAIACYTPGQELSTTAARTPTTDDDAVRRHRGPVLGGRPASRQGRRRLRATRG